MQRQDRSATATSRRASLVVRSEIKPQPQLNVACIAGCDGGSKIGSAKVGAISAPLRVVEDIIKLRPELKSAAFAFQDTGKILEQRSVGVVQPCRPHDIAAGIAEHARRGLRERSRIEPVGSAAMVVRIMEKVRPVGSAAD